MTEGRRRNDFFELTLEFRNDFFELALEFLTFCLAHYQPYEAMTGPQSSELLTNLEV